MDKPTKQKNKNSNPFASGKGNNKLNTTGFKQSNQTRGRIKAGK